MLRQRLAAVDRAERARVQHVDDVFVVRIGEDVRVVERALPDAARLVHQLPRARRHRRSCRGRPCRSRSARRRDSSRRRRCAIADLAVESLRQAAGARDLLPRLAAVGRLEEAAAGAAARHLVLDAVRLPQRREHHVRIPAIDLHVDAAGLGVAEQHFLPASCRRRCVLKTPRSSLAVP